MVDVLNSMEVYEKEVRARLHAKSKSAPKSFWSDTDSDEIEVTGGECVAGDLENIEVEPMSDRKHEPEGWSSSEDENSELTKRNFESTIRMRMKSPNYSKPIDLYSEAKKIEREKIEKRLKWEQRKWSDTFNHIYHSDNLIPK